MISNRHPHAIHSLRRAPSLLVAALLLFAAPALAASQAERLLGKMRDALAPGRSLRADVELSMTTESGQVTSWKGEVFRRGSDAAVRRFVFQEPRDIRGVELLFAASEGGSDRIEFYLPALGRVRKIRTDHNGESFLGTDFTFADLGFDEVDASRHAVVGEDEINGRGCVEVESIVDEPFGYGRIVRCIDEVDFLPRRTEYFDRAGRLWKVRTIERVKETDSKPVAVRIVMKDVQAGTSSALALDDVRLDVDFPDSALRIAGDTRPAA